jgi:undecaprenyl diphosphate synthase
MKKVESEKLNNIKSDSSLHIAIIMDGNGRWAKSKLKPRIFGHKAGMNKVKEITIHANKLGVKVLTLFAFSTENWNRPNEEVSFLMKLPIDFFSTFMPDLMKNNIQVKVIGNIQQLPNDTINIIQKAINDTKNNSGLILNFAMNYGSQQEIIEATKKISLDVKNEQLNIEAIDKNIFNKYLNTSFLGELSDPDLVIRTSGEYRLSNFMLFQIAYSELLFVDKNWPDFSTDDLENAIIDYKKRNRRFGKI